MYIYIYTCTYIYIYIHMYIFLRLPFHRSFNSSFVHHQLSILKDQLKRCGDISLDVGEVVFRISYGNYPSLFVKTYGQNMTRVGG